MLNLRKHLEDNTQLLMDFLQNQLEVDIPAQCLKNIVWLVFQSIPALLVFALTA